MHDFVGASRRSHADSRLRSVAEDGCPRDRRKYRWPVPTFHSSPRTIRPPRSRTQSPLSLPRSLPHGTGAGDAEGHLHGTLAGRQGQDPEHAAQDPEPAKIRRRPTTIAAKRHPLPHPSWHSPIRSESGPGGMDRQAAWPAAIGALYGIVLKSGIHACFGHNYRTKENNIGANTK